MFAVTNDIIANEFCSQIAWHLEVGLLEIELGLNPEPRASEKDNLSTPTRPTWRANGHCYLQIPLKNSQKNIEF